MSNFGQFYQQGGVFMHLVTLLSLAAAGMLAARAVRLRTLANRVLSAKPVGAAGDLGLVTALTVAALLCGVLGATFGLMETAGALQTIDGAMRPDALLRALPIAASPFAWALMLAVPLVLGRGVVVAVETRLRNLGTTAA